MFTIEFAWHGSTTRSGLFPYIKLFLVVMEGGERNVLNVQSFGQCTCYGLNVET
jgi:hypothetical protein